MKRILLGVFLVATAAWPQSKSILYTGLNFPQKIVVTAGGNLLISETSARPNEGRVSLVTRAGIRRTLIEGLPSGESAAGEPSGPTGLAIHGRTLYVAQGAGDSERFGQTPGTSGPNPAGASSRIHSSVLRFDFSDDFDAVTGAFSLTAEQQETIADGYEVTAPTAKVSLLADFHDLIPDPRAIYRGSNPWGIAVSADGGTLYVADASYNTVHIVSTESGRARRLVNFPPVPNAAGVPPVVDAVPTSVRIYGDQLLVSFLTGFPFVPGQSRVLAVNIASRTVEPFIFNLNSAVDVLWRTLPSGAPQFFVLEFSTDQTARPTRDGRVLRYNSPNPAAIVDNITAPVSMALDEATDTLFVIDLAGRIHQIRM